MAYLDQKLIENEWKNSLLLFHYYDYICRVSFAPCWTSGRHFSRRWSFLWASVYRSTGLCIWLPPLLFKLKSNLIWSESSAVHDSIRHFLENTHPDWQSRESFFYCQLWTTQLFCAAGGRPNAVSKNLYHSKQSFIVHLNFSHPIWSFLPKVVQSFCILNT